MATAPGESLAHAAAQPDRVWQLCKATTDDNGVLHISFRVIAADDFGPIPGVCVEINWWGTDGGVRIYVTDENEIDHSSVALSET